MNELVIPAGVDLSERATPASFPAGPVEGHGAVVNETDVPDEVLETYLVENANMLGLGSNARYTTYATQGNLMTRPKFRVPSSYLEEVILARDFAERDDDVGAALGAMMALAFGDGMQHSHPDEVTVALFDELSEETGVLPKFKEFYREWLVSGQVITATIFRPVALSFTPMGADRQRTRTVMVPKIAVIPAEQVRVIGNDIFGEAKLAYRPFNGRQERWLMEFFDTGTTAARKAEMRQEDPILSTLLTEQVSWQIFNEMGGEWAYGDPTDPVTGSYVYMMNPAMISRTTMPKGQWPYPRPPLAKIFPLLEAKRLLTIMDYALLESGANFLVVAKKGSDQKPALPEELANLRSTVARASRSGVLIGDHRLNIEIITPKLDELLNPKKRQLLGRKITQALMRVPDVSDSDAGASGAAPLDTEILSRVVASDRDDLRRHMVRFIYKAAAERNDSINGYPNIWFPKIVLQGMQFWSQMVITLRDRGDIPRKYAVEAAGFDWTAAVQQRKLEISSGDDKAMQPASVPFSSSQTELPDDQDIDGPTPKPGAAAPGPQDRGGGRPPGAANKKGAPVTAARPTRVISQNAGETVRAIWHEDSLRRIGDRTLAMLETYPEASIGRMSRPERRALTEIDQHKAPYESGAFTVVPLGEDASLGRLQVVRLYDGVAAVLGMRADDAVLARALIFRHPATTLDAAETALALGFAVSGDD